MLRKPPALDSGQPLADGVHLHNVRSAGKELIGDVLQFPARDKRLFKQGAAAAGKQKQHGILFGQPLYQRQSFFGGCKAVGIRHGMARLITAYAGDFALHMAVFGHHHAAVHVPQCLHGGVRHLPRSLARCHQQHPAASGLKVFQRTAHSLIRQHRLNAGTDDFIRIPPQCGIHNMTLLTGSARTLQHIPSTAARFGYFLINASLFSVENK